MILLAIALGAMIWISTTTLDPYWPRARLAPNKPAQPDLKPQVQIVAPDRKWLLIYLGLGIATVKELAAPADAPMSFDVTSASVWNTFYTLNPVRPAPCRARCPN